MIELEDWKKLELRVGEIKGVKEHPNADRLLILDVDLGTEKRQLVAGLKAHYKEKELVGKKVVVFANLKPATLRGVESQGMVLAADDNDDVVLISPEKKIKNGARIK